MAASDSFLFLLCLALLMAMAAATKFRVGGSMGWTVPSDPNAMSYNRWAERNRFQIGDSLLFVYQPGSDSVLQVSQDAYSTCSTLSPFRSYSDGNTEVKLDRSGPFYFISGVEKNCLRNESMVVVVLADRSSIAPSSGSPTMPPSPSSSSPPPSPAVAPTSSSPPSPSTAGSPPSPPSSSPSEVTPSPAPTGGKGSPAKNGAPLKAMGFMGTVGALLGPLLVL